MSVKKSEKGLALLMTCLRGKAGDCAVTTGSGSWSSIAGVVAMRLAEVCD